MMKVFVNTACHLLVTVAIFHQFQNTVGISWVVKPDAFTYGPQGTNISMRWKYELESDEEFLTSVLTYKDSDLAARHPGESDYAKYIGPQNLPFSISGADDVTLTIYDAKVLYNDKFCCEVDYKSAAGKLKTKECATLFVYVLPVITYLTPDVSSKQGDVVKLYCNATGYPQPSGAWIHKDNKTKIEDSFTTSLKIVSKHSSDSYCCQATNRFGVQTKCSKIDVTEYQPLATTLLSQQSYIIINKGYQAQCSADANPSPYYSFKQNDVQMQNSTKGVYVSDNITGKGDVKVSCVPWNKYGSGPERKIVLSVIVPELPKFANDLRTSYNLSAQKIKLTCKASGKPSPNITWTKGESKEIISTKDYYEVFHVCTNETLIFYCNANNVAGSTKSPQIKVHIHADARCIPEDKDGSPIYEPPKIANDMVTTYNLTTNSINITCKASGKPKPSITWTKGESEEKISTKAYYEVPFTDYEETKLIFYCHASNILGKVRSSGIEVNVMTKDKTVGFQVGSKRINNKLLVIIIAVSLTVVFLMVIVCVVLTIIWRTGNSRLKEAKKSPYTEPVDAVPVTVSGKVGVVVPRQEQHAPFIEEESPASDEKPVEKKGEEPIYAVVKKPPRSK